MSCSADDFITILRDNLSPLVHNDRTVNVSFKSSKGFSSRPFQSSVSVQFYNLPTPRVKERRGGGAEAENNRMMFWVHGFEEESNVPVDKVKVEQSVNSIYRDRVRSPNMRAKSGSPDKIAVYIANYINEVAEEFEPSFTHD